ncbi:hypothetical protein Tco_0777768 [Tanacetum coccineum]
MRPTPPPPPKESVRIGWHQNHHPPPAGRGINRLKNEKIMPLIENKTREDLQDNHEAIEKHSKEVEMMVTIKVKENVLDVVTQIISLENVQSYQRTPIKEHSIGGVWSDTEKDEGEKTKDEFACSSSAQ